MGEISDYYQEMGYREMVERDPFSRFPNSKPNEKDYVNLKFMKPKEVPNGDFRESNKRTKKR
jgi:hypothetical protein